MRTDRRVLIRVGFILVVVVVLAAPSRAEAGFTLVTSKSALGANDAVDWGSLGTLTTPNFSITSSDGTQVNGQFSGGGRQDEPVIIERSFSVGLAHMNGATFIQGVDTSAQQVGTFVSITFNFPKPVSGFGAAATSSRLRR